MDENNSNINVFLRKCENSFRFEIPKNEAPGKLYQVDTYAPAIPGVIVALFVLFVSNKITSLREKRKELLSLCDDIEEQIESAVAAVSEAWKSEIDERPQKIAVAKRKLQILGSNITELERRSPAKIFGIQHKKSINCLDEMSLLRRECTIDPFEDMERNSSDGNINGIHAAADTLLGMIRKRFHDSFN